MRCATRHDFFETLSPMEFKQWHDFVKSLYRSRHVALLLHRVGHEIAPLKLASRPVAHRVAVVLGEGFMPDHLVAGPQSSAKITGSV